MKESLGHAKDKIAEVAHDISEKVKEKAHDVSQWIQGKSVDVREKVAEKVEPTVDEKVHAEVGKAELEAKKVDNL